jgi:hypothetical protein
MQTASNVGIAGAAINHSAGAFHQTNNYEKGHGSKIGSQKASLFANLLVSVVIKDQHCTTL